MDEQLNLDNAKEIIENGISQAQELIKDPSKVDDLLEQLEGKLAEVPTVGTTLAEIPLMISMVKSYVTKKYEVSPKVVAYLVSAFIYVVAKNDLLPDDVPVLGYADDLGVLTLAIKATEPELNAYAAWRDEQKVAQPEA